METILVPPPIREKLGDAASDGLVMMFAEAHSLATERFERRLVEVTAGFERRLNEEISKLRLAMVEQMAQLRFDVVKWNFLFWIGQLAAMTAILSVMLRGFR